ncbi:MAG: UDP-N-acetylmuramate dehydrogenase [Dactylosporangium sp.]|nr:UDP-N-acetylmuramate dehydrogenase [Dactylosporangium sp.]NNJ61731.1 UDP-N-acetylmuramate dehydrogenase [Dactylosporangium sp.]
MAVDAGVASGQPLAPYTTLRLGGPADRLVVARTVPEIVQAVRSTDGPLLLLAGGSNVVIADQGFPGTTILVRTTGIAEAAGPANDAGTARVEWTVAAGEPWDGVCAAAAGAGLSGIECLSGIPGSTGATPVQNVGAYGQDVAETISTVRVLDRERNEIVVLPAEECGFTYRDSMFKRNTRYVILSVQFALTRSPLSVPIRYAELARTLGVEPGERAPLAATREAVLTLRARKGMVSDASDPDTWSVGSFFTNPVLDVAAMRQLRARASECGEPPAWPGQAGTVKTSAAWLIERAGFTRGYAGAHRTVALSGKHTLALTHRGGGTTEELLALARDVRGGVADRFGVTLRPEPVLVGCGL